MLGKYAHFAGQVQHERMPKSHHGTVLKYQSDAVAPKVTDGHLIGQFPVGMDIEIRLKMFLPVVRKLAHTEVHVGKLGCEKTGKGGQALTTGDGWSRIQ